MAKAKSTKASKAKTRAKVADLPPAKNPKGGGIATMVGTRR